MPDQATALRALVSRRIQQDALPDDQRPPIVAVAAGQREVGCTTLAINLAVAAARKGRRVVLLDAAGTRDAIAPRCGLDSRGTLHDVLTAHKLIDEVLLDGPAGVRIVPGGEAIPPTAIGELPAGHARHPPNPLHALGPHAELLVVDLGTAEQGWLSLTPPTDALWLVATPDPHCLLDTYARIKSLPPEGPSRITPRLIVNQAADAEAAARVHERIDQCCCRFLGGSVDLAGHVPRDSAIVEAERRLRPVMTEFAESKAARSLEQLAIGLPRTISGQPAGGLPP
jgi:flagellar biosynthesis protein FlhG